MHVDMGTETTRRFARGTPPTGVSDRHRIVIYSRVVERTRWMENELVRSAADVTIACNVADVIDLLIGGRDRPRPQMLVIDLDALSGGELFHIHRIREHGWGGTLLALGKVPLSLRSSLGIDRTLPPPYVENALYDEVVHHLADSTATTVPIPIPL